MKTTKTINFFDATQQALLRALQRPEFNIRGIRRADLVPFLRQISPASIELLSSLVYGVARVSLPV